MLSDGGGFNRHDLSHFYGFKCSTGHVVPVYADILNPNERVDIKIDRHVRLQPMVTPAFMDLECQIDYFFIPMTMLLQDFERQFSNTKEYFSRLITTSGSRNLCLFSGTIGTSSSSDLQLLRSRSNTSVEPFLGDDVNTNVTDNLPAFEDNGNRVVRLFDYLGLDLPSCWSDGVPIPDNPDGTHIDIVDDDGVVMTDYVRYFQGSGYRSSFPWKLLAYNCIWQHFYRLDDFIEFDNRFFNLDGIGSMSHPGSVFMQGSTVPNNTAEWCSIKYAPRSQDYFTSSVSSPVVQGMNILANILPQNQQWISGENGYYNAKANPVAGSQASGSLTDGSAGSAALYAPNYTLTQSFSMARLRLVKAQEKLLQIYGRLPKKNYDTFVHALFGQKVPHDVKHEISHLGKQVMTIGVKAIYSSASTSGAELGELAGTGEGSDVGRHIKFTAPVHGIIMATQFIRPTFMYAGGFLRENSITSYDDFFLPMFDNLGRQPVMAFEFGTYLSNRSAIAAWQFRWQEWKSKVNRVSRAFQFGNERSWFVVQDQQNTMINDQSSGVSISNAFRYVSPSSLDDIMVQQFETHFRFGWLTGQDYKIGKRWKDVVNYFTNPALVFSTDPFICLNRVKSSKFSKMSCYSLQTID